MAIRYLQFIIYNKYYTLMLVNEMPIIYIRTKPYREMKKYIIYTLVVFAALHASAQSMDSKFKLTFGAKFDFPKKHADLGFIGNEQDGLVQLSYRYKKDLTLQKLDNKYALKNTEAVNISKMPKSFISDALAKYGGKYYWFYSTWDSKSSTEHLSAQEVDVKNAKLAGAAKELISSTKLEGTLVAVGFYNIQKANKFQFSTNADSTKLLVTYRLLHASRDDSKNKEVIGFNVFDNTLNKLWNKEFTMPYTEEMVEIEDYAVDNKGDGYILAKVYEGKKKDKNKDGSVNYHYELLRASAGSKELKVIKIKGENRFLHDLFLTEDFEGNLVCAGYYSNSSAYSSDGIFITKLDAEGSLRNIHKGFYEFPSEILKSFLSERTQKKLDKKESQDKDLEVARLVLRNIIINKDGSVLLAGEQYYYTITIVRSGNSTRTRYNYFFNDILAMKINASGEMEWCHKIPKRQAGSSYTPPSAYGHRSMSYYLTSYNGDYYFFYTDNVKNQNLPKNQAPNAHIDGAGGFLVYSKITGSGEVSKGKLYDYREKDLYLWPADLTEIADGQLISRAFDGKASRVLKINMKDSK